MPSFGSIQTTTIREFDGGLNVVHDDLNMDTRYSTIETNVYNNINGTKAKRYGTKFFVDIKSYPQVEETFEICDIIIKNILTIPQDTNYRSKIKLNDEITVIEPITIAGDYKVTRATNNNFDINISLTSGIFTNIKYKQKGTNLERNASTSTFNNTKLLKFSTDNHNSLIIGSTLEIVSPEILKDTYTVIQKETDAYYIDISSKNVLTTQQNVQIKHDNRNIKGDYIVNCEYFVDKMILVSNIGEVLAVDGTGDAIIIWNDTIAKNVNKETDIEGWHETKSVCFTVFNGILTLWNGTDKPLAIDLEKQIPCNFLLDEGTLSNAFVPIAKYALAFNHYLVCGYIFDETEAKYYPDRISISARDTIGTFYSGLSDDVDNDGVYIDLGKIISSNKQTIKGISRYRNQICVGFDDVVVFGTLGKYTETTQTVDDQEIVTKLHTPEFEDVIDNHGCISNRTFAALKSELICLDYSGLPLFRKANLSTQIVPTRISSQISPELYTKFIGLNENVVEDNIFSIINPKDNQYLLFIPNSNDINNITETICYAYTLRNGTNSSVLDGAWSKFTGWNFQCGLTTALNEVFLINKTKLYILGNIDRQYFADFIDDPEYPPKDEEDISGKAIDFEWELPWTDFGNRAGTKHSRYIAISSTGTSKFDIDLFLDYIYYNVDGNKDPQLSLNFVGGDSAGYGKGKQPYGGGRRTNSEYLFAYTSKFKIAKFNIHGSSKDKLNINSLTVYYQSGNIRR